MNICDSIHKNELVQQDLEPKSHSEIATIARLTEGLMSCRLQINDLNDAGPQEFGRKAHIAQC